jgi:maltose-binding protein MalE
MKHLVLATVASLGLISGAAAQTSTTTTTTTGSTSATVTIQPEVRTKVKQYVTTSKPKSVTVPPSVKITKGTVLPETVEIQSFPSEVGVTEYRYAVVGDQTVLVEPSSRRIIEVVE